MRASISAALELGGSLGVLHTRTDAYTQDDGTLVPARVDLIAKDNFYYSNAPSAQQSHAYTLTNVKVGYERSDWSACFWVRNAFDKDYVVRAFEFGNEPPDFANALYLQHGEPRQVGITASWKY